MVALKFLDASKEHNVRVSATAKEVTAEGFRLNIRSWADTYLHMVKVQWIACGPTQPKRLSVEVGGALPKA